MFIFTAFLGPPKEAVGSLAPLVRSGQLVRINDARRIAPDTKSWVTSKGGLIGPELGFDLAAPAARRIGDGPLTRR